ncbi:hypothetical protein GOBAR_AA32467 [Gossypium barbadense]|uniref:Uncharacterized protein n=1 Tax=Gossypium barbadense TaxID=3634 RepID=A0A2P5WAX4_GOSBA|nr:hypothetical protein GOBAR_AA32467 [Gossypium barbadense]
MIQVLSARGIQIPNFAYDFFVLEGPHRLNDTSDGSFLLPSTLWRLDFICHCIQWSTLSKDMCSFKHTIRTDNNLAQLERYRRGDSKEVAEALSVDPEKCKWPRVPKSAQDELATTNTSRSDFKHTTSLSREFNEAMDLQTIFKDMRTNHIEPSSVAVTIPTSLGASSSLPNLASMPEFTMRQICIVKASTSSEMPPLSKTTMSLQTLLELDGSLGAVVVRNNELSIEVTSEKERNKALRVELRRVKEEHRVTMNRITSEHEAMIATSEYK